MEWDRFSREAFAGLPPSSPAVEELCAALSQAVRDELTGAVEAAFAGILTDLEQAGLPLADEERPGGTVLVAPLGPRELHVSGACSIGCVGVFGAAAARDSYPWPKRMTSPVHFAVRAAQAALERSYADPGALELRERRLVDMARAEALLETGGLRWLFASELGGRWPDVVAELRRIGALRSATVIEHAGRQLGLDPPPPQRDRVDILRALTAAEDEALLSLEASRLVAAEALVRLAWGKLAQRKAGGRADRRDAIRGGSDDWSLAAWSELPQLVSALGESRADVAAGCHVISRIASARATAVRTRRLGHILTKLAALGHTLTPWPHPCAIDLVDLDAPAEVRLRLTITGMTYLTLAVVARPRAPGPARPASVDDNLWAAIGRRDPDRVRAAIAAGADVNRRSRQAGGGRTPLECALAGEDVRSARVLLEAGARATGKHDRALDAALYLDQPDLVAAVLAAGASAAPRSNGNPMLGARSRACASLLATAGAELGAADDRLGWTPLMVAAMGSSVDLVRFFVERAADVDQLARYQGTALAFACRQPSPTPTIVLALLDAGADPDRARTRRSRETPRSSATPEARRVLEAFAAGGACLQQLRSDLAALELTERLFTASRHGDLPAVEAVLHEGANPRGGFADEGPPLLAAASFGHTAVVKVLLAAGAAPDDPGLLGRTALTAAVRQGQVETASVLLDAGAAVETDAGPSAVFAAIAGLCPVLVKMLTDLGVTARTRDEAQDLVALVRSKTARQPGAGEALDEIDRVLRTAPQSTPGA